MCKNHVQEVDYENVDEFALHLGEREDPRAPHDRRLHKHQRQVAVAIKRAREMALLPYIGPSDAPPALQVVEEALAAQRR